MHLLQDEPERRDRLRVVSATGLCALLLIGSGLWSAAQLPQPRAAPIRVSMRLVKLPSPRPAAEPPAVEPTPAKPPPPVAERPRTRRRKSLDRPQPTVPKTAPPEAPTVATGPVRLGLSLSSMGRNAVGPGFAVGDPVHGVAGGRAPDAKPAAQAAGPPTKQAKTVRREAKLQARVIPDYPRSARSEGIEGVVVIALTITADGRVAHARLLRGIGHGLDDAALAASRKTRWSPATLDGRPIRSQRRFNVRFTLDS